MHYKAQFNPTLVVKELENFQKAAESWGNELYAEHLQLKKQLDGFQSSSTTNQVTDEGLDRFADQEENNEHHQMISLNNQMQQEISSLHHKIDVINQDYKNLVRKLEQLTNELPETIHDIEIVDKSQRTQLDKRNAKIRKFQGDFRSLVISLTTNKFSLEHREREQIQTAAEAQNQESPIQPAKSNQEQLELQSIIKELRKIVSQLQPQVNHTTDERSPFQAELQNWNQYVSQLFPLLEQRFSEKVSSLNADLLKEIKNLALQTPEKITSTNIATSENIKDCGYEIPQTSALQPQATFPSQSSALPQLPLVSQYNQNPDYFSTSALEVSETEESINQRRLGNQAVIIEKVRKGRGNYWLITETNEHYLVPKGGLKINQYNLPTIEALFQCTGDSPENFQKFTLVQPAIVFPIESEKWRLEKLGMLEFEA
ncbi:hypothetical protein NIES2100_61750 [Calothrix sp. NIES-2100]|nr:hypothetical protein NIES2100_61750 [Calothrix sp. NIES-2100]